MRYLLLLSMLLSACVDRGTLLDIPPSAETKEAAFYDVFWFNEATGPDGKQPTCVGFEGATGVVAEYVERLTDAQTGDGPQTLPPDFKTNGVQLLISGDRHSRVAIALLDTNLQLVGVATYPSDIQVTTGENRRYQLTTQSITPQTGEWHAAVAMPGHERDSVLRFAATDFEYRIAPNRDFDGDDEPVATSATCPTIANRTPGLDCNDLSAAIKPQPGIEDKTCGRAEPDLDCRFDAKPIELCVAAIDANTCAFGTRACGDGGNGVCTVPNPPLRFTTVNGACPSTTGIAAKCTVYRGTNCRTSAVQIHGRLTFPDAPVCKIAMFATSQKPGAKDIRFDYSVNGNTTTLNHNGTTYSLEPCKLDAVLENVANQEGLLNVAVESLNPALGTVSQQLYNITFVDDCSEHSQTIECILQ